MKQLWKNSNNTPSHLCTYFPLNKALCFFNLFYVPFHNFFHDYLHGWQIIFQPHWHSNHFVYVPSQWEMTLHCNVVSHWLGAYTKWSLLAGGNKSCQCTNKLFNSSRVLMCIRLSKLGLHWFILWPVVCSVLMQCWLSAIWILRNKLWWNLNQNTTVSIQEHSSKMLPTKWWPFGLNLNVLTNNHSNYRCIYQGWF